MVLTRMTKRGLLLGVLFALVVPMAWPVAAAAEEDTVFFAANFEDGAAHWTLEGAWQVETDRSHKGAGLYWGDTKGNSDPEDNDYEFCDETDGCQDRAFSPTFQVDGSGPLYLYFWADIDMEPYFDGFSFWLEPVAGGGNQTGVPIDRIDHGQGWFKYALTGTVASGSYRLVLEAYADFIFGFWPGVWFDSVFLTTADLPVRIQDVAVLTGGSTYAFSWEHTTETAGEIEVIADFPGGKVVLLMAALYGHDGTLLAAGAFGDWMSDGTYVRVGDTELLGLPDESEIGAIDEIPFRLDLGYLPPDNYTIVLHVSGTDAFTRTLDLSSGITYGEWIGGPTHVVTPKDFTGPGVNVASPALVASALVEHELTTTLAPLLLWTAGGGQTSPFRDAGTVWYEDPAGERTYTSVDIVSGKAGTYRFGLDARVYRADHPVVAGTEHAFPERTMTIDAPDEPVVPADTHGGDTPPSDDGHPILGGFETKFAFPGDTVTLTDVVDAAMTARVTVGGAETSFAVVGDTVRLVVPVLPSGLHEVWAENATGAGTAATELLPVRNPTDLAVTALEVVGEDATVPVGDDDALIVPTERKSVRITVTNLGDDPYAGQSGLEGVFAVDLRFTAHDGALAGPFEDVKRLHFVRAALAPGESTTFEVPWEARLRHIGDYTVHASLAFHDPDTNPTNDAMATDVTVFIGGHGGF
ncbi:MAG: hypothetical protein KY455_12700 [Euryarchaeota archaeon]|nr:hypothetical protein [Euryarchaeota archaeon]